MDCLKALYSVGLIDERYSEDIPKIVRMRNNIVHIYDFSLAKDLFKFIREKVIPAFGSIIKALRNNCAK